MVNDKGELFLKYVIKGTASKPNVDLVHPKLGSLSDLVKDALGDVAGNVADAAKDKAQKKVEDKVDQGKDKAVKKIKKLF